MSEYQYQYVVFQAVDGPLNDKPLKFAPQSTRAEASRWSLSVEYHYPGIMRLIAESSGSSRYIMI